MEEAIGDSTSANAQSAAKLDTTQKTAHKSRKHGRISL
jgi:hypothetical protein